jgi:hypothetical protein
MQKKYWAIIHLPAHSDKGFFNDHKEIGNWILKLLPISKNKFDKEQNEKPEEEREEYPSMTFEKICDDFLHVLNIENAAKQDIHFLRDTKELSMHR